MLITMPKSGILIAGLVSLLALGVMACGGAETTAPAAAAAAAPAAAAAQPAAPAQPLPAQPGAAAAAPAPAALPAAAAAAAAPKGVSGGSGAIAERTIGESGAAATSVGPASPTDPKYLAKKTAIGKYSFKWSGPAPTTYNESPMLAELVKAGKLPPVHERLPDQPQILPPTESIGVYGGTWRRAYIWNGDHAGPFSTDKLSNWDGDGASIMNELAKDFVISSDGRSMTITLRKGHKWSDGAPFTSADFKWSWDALANNKDFTPAFRVDWLSPVTKNPPTQEILDDVTIRYTWDDPNFGQLETKMQGVSFTYGQNMANLFAPGHYLGQFHPDYQDKATLDKLVSDDGFDNWVQLLKIKGHAYQSEDLPTLSAWHTIDSSEGAEWILERNAYYGKVDPAGNQLPYFDRVHLTLMENIETVNLKSIAGEIDMQVRHHTMARVPLYKKHEAQSNYWTHHAPGIAPTDGTINLNRSYEVDAVLGKLLLERDFRIALSLGADREEINELFFLGLGQPRAFSPDPGTLYWPGKDFHFKYSERDLTKANALLDGLGLTERDADGFRLRSDGKTLTLHFVLLEGYETDWLPMAEMLGKHWKKIGIKSTYKESRNAHVGVQANEQYLFIWGYPGWSPWLQGIYTLPLRVYCRCAVEVGRWYGSGGASGDKPDLAKYVNPEGEYPLKQMIDLHDEGLPFPMVSPERVALGQKLFQLVIDDMLHIPSVGGTGSKKGVGIVKSNLKNFPGADISGSRAQGTMGSSHFTMTGAHAELYFFENGKNDAGF